MPPHGHRAARCLYQHPRTFSRARIRPTVETEVCQLSRAANTWSVSLPKAGYCSRLPNTAWASSGLHCGRRNRLGQRLPSYSPCGPSDLSRLSQRYRLERGRCNVSAAC